MLRIQFPEPSFSIKSTPRGDEIFDSIRKKWLLLTPEEWVRQNFISWLVECLQVPDVLIAQERKIELHGRWRRFDIVVYSRQMKPWLLVECKAMDVPINEKVIQQALAYHSVIDATMMAVSNGRFTYAWRFESGNAVALDSLPAFDAQ